MDNFNNRYIPVRERIFTLLESKKIQQKDFAKAVGVYAQTVTEWKKGKSFSFAKRLDVIAKALETTEEWLLLGEEKAPTPIEGSGRLPEFIQLYEQLTDTEKALIIKQIKGILSGK